MKIRTFTIVLPLSLSLQVTPPASGYFNPLTTPLNPFSSTTKVEQPANPILNLQINNNSISGHIADSQHSPVPNIRVELLNEVDTVIQSVKTDGSGLFVFRKLSDGAFQVRVQTAGTNYLSQTKRVDLAKPHGFGAAFEEIEFVLTTNHTPSTPTKPGVVFAQDVPEQARKFYEKALDLVGKNKHTEAMLALRAAIEAYPQYFDALELLGSEMVKYGKNEQAVPILTRALEVNPRAFESSYALGVAQFNLGQVEPAIESLRRAVMLNEKSVNANLWLGIALRNNKLDESEIYLRRAEVLSESKLPDVHWHLALLLYQLKRYTEAADELEVFLKVQPDSRDAELIKKLIKKMREQAAKSVP
jgi:TolA-binding protein